MRIHWLLIFSFLTAARVQGQFNFFDVITHYEACDSTGGTIQIVPFDPTKKFTYLMFSNDCSFPLRTLQDSGVFSGLPPCRYSFKIYDETGDSTLMPGIKLGLQLSGFEIFQCQGTVPDSSYRMFNFHNGKPPYTLRARKGSVWLPDVLVITSESSVAVFDTLKDQTIEYFVIDSCGDSDQIPIPRGLRTQVLDREILCDDSQILSFPLKQDDLDWTRLDVKFQWKLDGNIIGDSSAVKLEAPLNTGLVIVRVAKGSCYFNYFRNLVPEPSKIINLQVNTDKTVLCADDFAQISASVNLFRPTKIHWSTGDSSFSIQASRAGIYAAVAENDAGCLDTAVVVIDSSAFRLQAEIVDNKCFAEARAAIDLTLTGGRLPFRYEWEDNINTEDRTNLTNGKYKIRVIDSALCAIQDSFQITSPPPLLLSLTATAADCAIAKNGKVFTSVQGGVPPYTYQWSNGLTVPAVDTLVPGMYTFTVLDSNLCTSPFTFGIGELAPFTNSRVDTICANSSLQVGSSSYNLTGRYIDTLVTSLGCDSILTTYLTVNLPVDFRLTAQSPGCIDRNDGILTINDPLGLPAFTYYLNDKVINSPQVTGLAPGNYVVKLTDRLGCTTEKGIALTQPERIQVSLGRDTLVRFGDSLHMRIISNLGAGGIKNVQWTTSQSNTNCINCGSEYTYVPTVDHMIKVVLEGITGCKAEDEILVSVSRDFKVFIPNIFKPDSPNPENQYLTIKGGNQISQIKYFRIFNRFGDRVFEAENFLPDDFMQGWDGKFRNADAAEDVYVYIVDLVYIDGTEKLIKGDFVLMR